MPSFVVTLFVGTNATDFDPYPLVGERGELRLADIYRMAQGRNIS